MTLRAREAKKCHSGEGMGIYRTQRKLILPTGLTVWRSHSPCCIQYMLTHGDPFLDPAVSQDCGIPRCLARAFEHQLRNVPVAPHPGIYYVATSTSNFHESSVTGPSGQRYRSEIGVPAIQTATTQRQHISVQGYTEPIVLPNTRHGPGQAAYWYVLAASMLIHGQRRGRRQKSCSGPYPPFRVHGAGLYID